MDLFIENGKYCVQGLMLCLGFENWFNFKAGIYFKKCKGVWFSYSIYSNLLLWCVESYSKWHRIEAKRNEKCVLY